MKVAGFPAQIQPERFNREVVGLSLGLTSESHSRNGVSSSRLELANGSQLTDASRCMVRATLPHCKRPHLFGTSVLDWRLSSFVIFDQQPQQS